MKKSASTFLEARLSLKKRPATGLCDERLSSCVEVVNYLLATQVPNDIIARAIKKLELYNRSLGVSVALYAKRLYTKAPSCEIVYEVKRVKALFVAGLDESVCDSLRVYLGQHTHAPLTGLAR